ncbi:MAG: hypothetical protein E4H36_01900 [Spirochaetales bacterium]|nr:MAG: hypothetical protein E4H36_01900 [Spirochaetales bacterium]
MKMSRALSVLPFIALLAGCAGVSFEPPAVKWLSLLPSDSGIIIKARVRAVEPVLGSLFQAFSLSDKDAGEIIRRTRDIYLGIIESEEAMPDFSIILVGDFPQAAAALFTPAKGWKKNRSYWTHDETGIQIALPEAAGRTSPHARALFVSRGHIEEMLKAFGSPGTAERAGLPTEAEKEFDVSDLVVYMPHPGKSGIAGSGVNLNQFPIKNIWFTLERTVEGGTDRYLVSGVFTLDTADRAGKFISLLKLLLLGIIKKENLDAIDSLKNDTFIRAEDEYVRLSGLRLEVSDLAKLMTAVTAP